MNRILYFLSTCFRTQIIALLLFILTEGCSSQSNSIPTPGLPRLIPYRKGNLWGYCDQKKNIIIPCKYKDVGLFDDYGIARVSSEDNIGPNEYLSGLIDSTGKVIVPLKYDFYKFSYKVLPYDGGRTDKFGIYDAYKWNNQLVIITYLNNSNEIGYDKVFISESNYKRVVFDRSGNKILSDSFESIGVYPSTEDAKYLYAKNKFDKKTILFDIQGKRFNNLSFDQIRPLNDQFFIGLDKDIGEGIYSLNGETILSGRYSFDGQFGNNIIMKELSGEERFFNIVKREFVAEPFNTLRSYRSGETAFFVLSHKKDKIVSYTIVNTDLKTIVPGAYNNICIDTILDKISLYNIHKAICTDFSGNELVSFDDVDTILPISETRYFIKKATGCGIWSAAEKKYIIPPNYKSVNYTLHTLYVLTDNDNHYILTDSNGIASPETYKTISVQYEEIEYLMGPLREIRQLVDPLYITREYAYCGKVKQTSVRFILLNQHHIISNNQYLEYFARYRQSDYYIKLRQYVASVCYIIAEKNNGEIYIIDGAGKKLSLGTKRVYISKHGNLVISQEGEEINGRMKNSRVFTCKSMDGKEFPGLSFASTGGMFYADGQMNIIIGNDINDKEKKGVLLESGQLLLPIEYDDINQYALENIDRTGFVANNSKGSVVYRNNKLVFKISDGIIITHWLGNWGIVTNYARRNEPNATGAINMNGKIIIPLKYEISSWYDYVLIETTQLEKTSSKLMGYFDVNGNRYFD